MTHTTDQTNTSDGISWHIERFQPPDTSRPIQEDPIILIPSGEGDCQNLLQLGSLLSTKHGYTVLTFDNPGFSRTLAPASAYEEISPRQVAQQIRTLCTHLGINRASAFGCSSGGTTVLALIERDPSFIKCGIIHEIPLAFPDAFKPWFDLGDTELSEACMGLFANVFVERKDLWAALGPEYHERLSRNYVTWFKRGKPIVPEGVEMVSGGVTSKAPLFWTVGALNAERDGFWKADFEYAEAAGVTIDTNALKSLHFPAVTVPDATADWIDACIRSV